jgi:hypothetical protein
MSVIQNAFLDPNLEFECNNLPGLAQISPGRGRYRWCLLRPTTGESPDGIGVAGVVGGASELDSLDVVLGPAFDRLHHRQQAAT